MSDQHDAPSLRDLINANLTEEQMEFMSSDLLRHDGTPGCTNPECGEYPYYGVAPHECFYKKGPEFRPGQSTLLPREEWPANFVLDLEPGEDPATVAYPNACGVYYCPSCKAGMPDLSGLSTSEEGKQ